MWPFKYSVTQRKYSTWIFKLRTRALIEIVIWNKECLLFSGRKMSLVRGNWREWDLNDKNMTEMLFTAHNSESEGGLMTPGTHTDITNWSCIPVCEERWARYWLCFSPFTKKTLSQTLSVSSVFHYRAMWFLLAAESQSVQKLSYENSKICICS